MIEWLANPKYAARIAEEQAQLTEARKAKHAKVDAIEQQLVDLEVKKANDDIIEAAYQAAKAVLDRKLVKARADLADAPPVAAVRGKAGAEARAKTTAARLAQAEARWTSADSAEKRALMRRYSLHPVVLPKPASGRGADPRDRIEFV